MHRGNNISRRIKRPKSGPPIRRGNVGSVLGVHDRGLRDGDSKGHRNLESGWTSTTIPKRFAKLSNPFSCIEPAGVEPRRAGCDDWGTDDHRPYAGREDAKDECGSV